MNHDLLQQRHEAHMMIDALSQEKLYAVRNLLQVLVAPLSEALAASALDEEELTQEAVASIERGQRALEQGNSTSHEEMLLAFGA